MSQTAEGQTESLLDIVKGIDAKKIMLPEFQRDFRWEMEQTYDLFDSLVRNIFVGTIIYGTPSFGLSLREIDLRPRKGKGSNAPLQIHNLSSNEIVRRVQAKSLRIVLDGQQRITSIYRSMVGIDTVYVILRNDLDADRIAQLTLEEMVDSIAGEETDVSISVKLSDAYHTEIHSFGDEELNTLFAKSTYARHTLDGADETKRKQAEKLYRRALRRIIDLFKQEKMLSYYLLDMSLDKFCLFFERSNSRGIQLNFTDILAAKLYHGFNLRRKIEEFESESKLSLNREIVVRAIAYVTGSESGQPFSIDKAYILEKLDANDFNTHWDTTCRLYAETIEYLTSQHYVLSQDWMPSENMVIPLMMFRRELRGFDQMTEHQRTFLQFWYWASIFANRYSSASNEVIITDSGVLGQVARKEAITMRNFFTKLRSLIQEPDDLYSYTKKSSATYRGILNLIGFHSRGLLDWNSTHKIGPTMRLEDHHIYPRAYIASEPPLDMDQAESLQLVDCVVNRTLIPKLLNIQVGKKAPQTYLSALQRNNPDLSQCLATHLMPMDIISEPSWNEHFKLFLQERSQAIFGLIEQYAIQPYSEMVEQYSGQSVIDTSRADASTRKARLQDMLADGRIKIGDRIYVRKHPERFATIVSNGVVEYEGQRYSINIWGQKMTGWPSINIYESIFLERTNQPIAALR